MGVLGRGEMEGRRERREGVLGLVVEVGGVEKA